MNLPNPIIIVDVRAPNKWRGDEFALWRHTGESLDGCVALLGEHVDNPVRHDDAGALEPIDVIEILANSNVRVIATVTGRDRDAQQARELITMFKAAGATAIHCVTGDHPASMGLDRAAWFGTESMELVSIAVSEGLAATVGESPASPGSRASRLRAKQIAGASLGIINHGGSHDELIGFADATRLANATLPLVAPVPMIGDMRAALGLASFPGLRLPHGYLDAIIDAVDPVEEGRCAAKALISNLARSERFAGINLSGSAAGIDPWERLEATVGFIEIARAAWAGTIGI